MENLTVLKFVLATVITFSSGDLEETAVFLDHSQALEKLENAGISIFSSGNCDDRNNSKCVSFDHIREDTISDLIILKTTSECTIVVIGGTEAGHTSLRRNYTHWNGYRADIQPNRCINTYIHRRFTYIGHRSDGASQYGTAAGNLYTLERKWKDGPGQHWDLCVCCMTSIYESPCNPKVLKTDDD